MSYEGYQEKLCSNGHLSYSSDIYEDFAENESLLVCNFCKEPFVFIHSIDETNGILFDSIGKEILSTISYPFIVIGYDDDWKKDHYGNSYSEKVYCYEIPSGAKQQ